MNVVWLVKFKWRAFDELKVYNTIQGEEKRGYFT
jgi:hypothetical protein